MADVSADIKDWSIIPSSNQPADATTIGAGMADNFQQIQATVRAALAHKGSDLNSAATIDLGANTGFYHDIAGATGPITSFGTVGAGIWKILQFDSTPTITHNATSMILPGGASITMTAGTHLMAMSLGGGNWIVPWITGASGTAYKLNATGSVTTTQNEVNNRHRSVFDWMTPTEIADVVAGTFLVDVTTALQSAITNTLGTIGNDLEWPDGGYLISATLSIPQIARIHMFGQSRAVEIRQNTNNTPIFTLTTCDSSDFEISHFKFSWTTQQTSANTSSVAIYFAGTSGTPANGFYNFDLHHLTFSKGFRSISANDGIQLSLWGWDIHHISHESTMVGSMIYLNPSPSIGIPNCSLRNMYLRADAAEEEIINLHGIGALILQSIEINNGTIGGTGKPSQHILLTNCANVVINSCREESVTIDADNLRVWNFSSSNVHINGAEFGSIGVNSGFSGYCITSSAGKTDVIGMTVSKGTIAGAALYFFNGTFGVLQNYAWAGAAGTGFLISGGTVVFDDLRFQRQNSVNVGDANIVLTGTSERHQYFNTELTGNKTCTLPTPTFAGQEYQVTRSAATPGAFTLQVIDPVGALNHTIASNTKGWVTYISPNGSVWLIADAGTL